MYTTKQIRRIGSVMGMLCLIMLSVRCNKPSVSPEEVQGIAKEAYIYGFPMVDSYRIQYSYAVDKESPEYKAPWNQITNVARVYTPEDKTVQTPNSDTPYSMLGLDLRTEPIVLTVPVIEGKRYFSVQLIDLYTHNFDYIGSRTTGNGGGSFLIAGPDWTGEGPENVKVMRAETDLVLVIYRTQLFNEEDIDNVKQIQEGYKVQPLSAFLGQPAPTPAPPIDFIKPLTSDEERTSLEFFNVLNFLLQFCPPHPSEKELMDRFAKIGIGAGKVIDVNNLSPEVIKAMEQGIADAWSDFTNLKRQTDAGEVSAGAMFGSREYLKNNYLYRMGAAVVGIFGNSKEEAMYPLYAVDSQGQPLDASTNQYTIRFAPGQRPPVNAFWSLTMYELPASLLTVNPINRYLLNSPMESQFKQDADGGWTFYIQHGSPGNDKESNWLPAPKGPFFTVMRLYWPKEEALNGTWMVPPLVAVEK
jgi:hypothetical protein